MRKNEIVRAKRNQVAVVKRGRRILHAVVSEIAWQVNELDRRTDLTHQLLAHTIINDDDADDFCDYEESGFHFGLVKAGAVLFLLWGISVVATGLL